MSAEVLSLSRFHTPLIPLTVARQVYLFIFYLLSPHTPHASGWPHYPPAPWIAFSKHPGARGRVGIRDGIQCGQVLSVKNHIVFQFILPPHVGPNSRNSVSGSPVPLFFSPGPPIPASSAVVLLGGSHPPYQRSPHTVTQISTWPPVDHLGSR